MPDDRRKIVSPTPDTLVVGEWTLARVVALMDRMAGVFAAVDLPNPGPIKHTLVSWRHHMRVPVGPDPNQNGYAIRSDQLSRFNGFGYNPASRHPGGLPVWKITIAHHKRPYRSEPWRQPCITAERLGEFCDAKEIEYVFVEGTGIEADLDFACRIIDQSEKCLETVGPWLQDNLWIHIQCRCGRERSVGAREIFGGLAVSYPISHAVKKLRCTKCNEAGIRRTTPYFEGGASALDRYRRGASEHATRFKLGDLDDLYKIVGGDGAGPAYLGDGVFIGPDGTLSE